MRAKLPKEVVARRNQPTRPKPVTAAHSEWKWDWKYWLATVLAVAGLILGAITLQARPTISLESPLDPNDVFSTPIIISNDGMLALNTVNVQSFFTYINYEGKQSTRVQHYEIGGGFSPPDQTLEIGEKETVNLQYFLGSRSRQQSDIGLVVFFKSPCIPILRHRVFRFSTVAQKDGTLRLQQQPSGNIYSEYEQAVKVFTDQH